MIKEILICLALTNMNGVVNEHNVCSNVELISELSEKHKIDSHLFVSIMWAESRFKEKAKSNGGACGITQVLPKYTRPRVNCEDLKNPKVGIYYGYKTFSIKLPSRSLVFLLLSNIIQSPVLSRLLSITHAGLKPVCTNGGSEATPFPAYEPNALKPSTGAKHMPKNVLLLAKKLPTENTELVGVVLFQNVELDAKVKVLFNIKRPVFPELL